MNAFWPADGPVEKPRQTLSRNAVDFTACHALFEYISMGIAGAAVVYDTVLEQFTKHHHVHDVRSLLVV